MVWCYCSICDESEKVVNTQTERLHRQEEFGRIDHSINNSQKLENYYYLLVKALIYQYHLLKI